MQSPALRGVTTPLFQRRRCGTSLALIARMTKRVRSMFLFLTCAALIAWSSLSLTAKPEALGLCCGGDGDCGGVYQCCHPEALGLPPCDEILEGICRATCIPPGQQ